MVQKQAEQNHCRRVCRAQWSRSYLFDDCIKHPAQLHAYHQHAVDRGLLSASEAAATGVCISQEYIVMDITAASEDMMSWNNKSTTDATTVHSANSDGENGDVLVEGGWCCMWAYERSASWIGHSHRSGRCSWGIRSCSCGLEKEKVLSVVEFSSGVCSRGLEFSEWVQTVNMCVSSLDQRRANCIDLWSSLTDHSSASSQYINQSFAVSATNHSSLSKSVRVWHLHRNYNLIAILLNVDLSSRLEVRNWQSDGMLLQRS